MPQQIYINLPVSDLESSKTFYQKLGFEIDARFTNDVAAGLVVGENIFLMLLTEPFFKTFTEKKISNARESTEVLLCISREDRAGVDALVAKAKEAGGSITGDPKDHGFMYGHGFEDLDGHIWEVMYMDMDSFPGNQG